MKRIILALGLAFAPLLATPAFGQAVTATLPVTCPPSGVNCVQSTPVVNPDGTNVGGGGAYTGPAATQLPATLGAKTGASSLSVVPNTDTPFAVSSTTLATAAKQPALGTAGASSADVITVQGIASGTPQPTREDGVADATVSSASVSSAAVGATFSTAGYGSVTFQIVANASGNTVTIEGSNDGGTTWSVISVRNVAGIGNLAASANFNASTATTYTTNGMMPQMRWRVSNFIGGTTTIAVGMKRWSFPNVMDVNVGNASLAVSAIVGSQAQSANIGAFSFAETTTPLTGSATFTGTARDLNQTSTGSVAMFGATFTADQVGTAYIDYSTDNTTWVVAGSVAVTAGTLAAGPTFDINVRIRARYYRVRFVNGAVAQTVFRVVSSFTAS